ncbi:MAG TPA: MCE family protein [Acidimicrobiales bacterium]|nr:MCE family protein [Acidimicrobiales bacterium]
MSRGGRATVAAAMVLVLLAVATLVVKAAYGAYSGGYELSGSFARAGEGLHKGSQVEYQGVTVGQVSSISLADRKALVVMKIQSGFVVPADARATISPKNVFGEEVVDLSFPTGEHPPALAAGGVIRSTAVSDEITQLLAAADPLLDRLNGNDLATVISELSQASAGQGPNIAASINEGTKLANLFDDTLQAQIRALDSFTGFSQALAPTGNDLNAIARNNNLALPAFNAQAAAYQKVLDSFTPVADELGRLMQYYHPNIATILTSGDNVVRVLIARQQNISDLIHGLYRYSFKFASGASPETLPNGTKFAYFKTFVLFSDVNSLVCGLIAPPQPGLSYLQPLQQALTGPGSPFNCSAQIAAFDRVQAGAPAPAVPSAQQAAQQLANHLGQIIGTPQPAQPGTVGDVLAPLLGAQP